MVTYERLVKSFIGLLPPSFFCETRAPSPPSSLDRPPLLSILALPVNFETDSFNLLFDAYELLELHSWIEGLGIFASFPRGEEMRDARNRRRGEEIEAARGPCLVLLLDDANLLPFFLSILRETGQEPARRRGIQAPAINRAREQIIELLTDLKKIQRERHASLPLLLPLPLPQVRLPRFDRFSSSPFVLVLCSVSGFSTARGLVRS